MASPAHPQLYDVLKAEGFNLPDECRILKLDMPANGVFTLTYQVFIKNEDLVKLGRALQRLSEKPK